MTSLAKLTNRLQSSDRGVSLTELVVYVGLFAIVSIIAGSVFFTYFDGEKAVQNITQATNNGQVISTDLTKGIQSASEIAIGPMNASGSQFIVATVGNTTQAATEWNCKAWYFTEDGSVLTRTSSSAITEPDGDFTGWNLLASGVKTDVAYLAPQQTFSATSATNIAVNYDFTFNDGIDWVRFDFEVAKKVQASGGSLTCF